MRSKVNYTTVGFFVVLLTTVLVIGSLWLAHQGNTKVYNKYLVYMDENVAGLSEQAPVKYNGVTVGYVDKISLNKANPQQVVLTLEIEQGTPITTATTATLLPQGITGITYIGLKASAASAPPLKAKANEAYPVIPSSPSLLVQLDSAIRDMTTNFKSLSENVHKVFNDKNTEAIAKSLANISKFTTTLSDNSDRINKSLATTQKLIQNTEVASKQFNSTLTKVSHASDEVSTTMKTSRVLINNLSQQTLPGIYDLIDQMQNVANNLQKATSEIKQNPSILIRGKVPPKAGPGEKNQ